MTEGTPQDFTENVNSNTEYGVVLSGMLVVDAFTGEKIIVKAAALNAAEAATMLREAGEALIAEFGEQLAWIWDYRRDQQSGGAQPQPSAPQQTNTPAPPSTDSAEGGLQGDSGQFVVKNVTYLNEYGTVYINGVDGETIKIHKNYAKGDYAQFFPQTKPDGSPLGTFMPDAFRPSSDAKFRELYSADDTPFKVLCHWKRNGEYLNLAHSKDSLGIEIIV